VIFEKLELKNFLSFEEAKIEFEKGLYYITGWNEDEKTANGVGKTAITDGICWTLTGKMPRDINIDNVVNWKVGKKCTGELIIREEGYEYRILRGRSPNKLEFYKGRAEATRKTKITGQTVKETQLIIERELGINYELFINSVYFTQNSIKQFVTANDNDKKDLLTDLLNLEIFDSINTKIKENIKENKNKLSEVQINKAVTLNAEQILKDQLNEHQELETQFNHSKKEEIKRIELEIIKTGQEFEADYSLRMEEKKSFIKKIEQEEIKLSDYKSKLSLTQGQIDSEKLLLFKARNERSEAQNFLIKYRDEFVQMKNSMSMGSNLFNQDILLLKNEAEV